MIQIYEYVFNTPNPGPNLIFDGNVDAAGNVVISAHMYRHITFSATYAGDALYTPVTTSVTVTALARITETMSGSYGTSGSYQLFHSTVNPQMLAAYSPARPSFGCAWFSAERFTGGVWTRFAQTGCLLPNSLSQVAGTRVGPHSIGTLYRMQAILSGDTENAGTYGPYVYLRFTT